MASVEVDRRLRREVLSVNVTVTLSKAILEMPVTPVVATSSKSDVKTASIAAEYVA